MNKNQYRSIVISYLFAILLGCELSRYFSSCNNGRVTIFDIGVSIFFFIFFCIISRFKNEE